MIEVATFRGDRLRNFRIAERWSQDELGERIGIAGTQLGRYERGLNEPSLELISKMADTFNVSIDYLLGRTDKANRLEEDKLAPEELELIFEARRSRSTPELLAFLRKKNSNHQP